MLKNILRTLGRHVTPRAGRDTAPRDMEPEFETIFRQCRPYTMTSRERMYALYKAVEHVVQNDVPGDVIECGVWRGGSSMLCALALRQFGDTSRTIHLFDTYAGMSEPTARDVFHAPVRLGKGPESAAAVDLWPHQKQTDGSAWCYAPLEDVRVNMEKTGYPAEKIRMVKGKVEDTLIENAPDCVALMRLDTDWYESTLHELEILYPRLSPGGILLLDDYGAWQGAREAVEEYFQTHPRPFLSRIDDTGRIAVKIEACT